MTNEPEEESRTTQSSPYPVGHIWLEFKEWRDKLHQLCKDEGITMQEWVQRLVDKEFKEKV